MMLITDWPIFSPQWQRKKRRKLLPFYWLSRSFFLEMVFKRSNKERKSIIRFKQIYAGGNTSMHSTAEKAASGGVMVNAQPKVGLRDNIWKTHQSELILAVCGKSTPVTKAGSDIRNWRLQFAQHSSSILPRLLWMVHMTGLHSAHGFPCTLYPIRTGQIKQDLTRTTEAPNGWAWLHPAERQMQCQEEFSRLPASSLGQQ